MWLVSRTSGGVVTKMTPVVAIAAETSSAGVLRICCTRLWNLDLLERRTSATVVCDLGGTRGLSSQPSTDGKRRSAA
jgi:hypothetical protein